MEQFLIDPIRYEHRVFENIVLLVDYHHMRLSIDSVDPFVYLHIYRHRIQADIYILCDNFLDEDIHHICIYLHIVDTCL